MEICYKCSARTVCKYFSLLSSFPGTIHVDVCNVCSSMINSAEPCQSLNTSKVFAREQRSIDDLNAVAAKSKELDEQDKKNKTDEFITGRCEDCGRESDSLVRCYGCGELICPNCTTTNMSDGKAYCTECFDML